jgi:hypothetical protein
MSFKTTYILFGVLAALLLVFGFSQMFGTRPSQEGYVMADLHREGITPEKIDVVEIDRKEPKAEKIVFTLDRPADRWKMTQPFAARADSDTIKQLIRQVVDAKKQEEGTLTPDLPRYGLVPPQATVFLRQGIEHEWILNIGKSFGSEGDQVVYVASGKNPDHPLAVKRTDLDAALKPLSDYRSRDLLTETGDWNAASKTDRIEVEETGHPAIVLTKGKGERWRFEKPPYGDADYDGGPSTGGAVTGVRPLLTDLDSIRIDPGDFVADSATDFAKYGLEAAKPERLRVSVRRKTANAEPGKEKTDEVTRTLLVGKKADDKSEKFYARLDNESAIVKVSARELDPVLKFAADPGALRNRDLVDIDQAKVDAINIENSHGKIELRKPQATWTMENPARPADATTITSLLSDLAARRNVQSFPDAAERDLGLDRPQATISLWTEGLEKPGPAKPGDKKPAAQPRLKSSQPAVTLTFGRSEGDRVYVRRETAESKAIVAVPSQLLAKLTKPALAFADRTLPSFSENAAVASVIVERQGQTDELKNEAKDSKLPGNWRFERPKELAGRPANTGAIDHIIAELRGLHTDKLVADQQSPAVLEQFGLKSPAAVATIRVLSDGKKAEEWVYRFGKETPEKSGRYASLNKTNLVFVAPAISFQALQNELQDPTVLHLDPAAVTTVKLVGWKQAVGSTFTLEAERKDQKEWKIKSPPDFDLDAGALDAFISGLTNLQAVHFLRSTAIKPEMKLGATDRLMTIEIGIAGGKAPTSLTLGNLNLAEKAYYAQSTAMPGVVFLVPEARFEKLLASPKFFSKGSGK